MADRENKPIEIVKRIEAPESEEKESVETSYFDENMHNKEYYHEEYHEEEYYQEEEISPFRRMLPTLFGITTVGIIGYFGFSYLNQESLISERKESKAIIPYTEELAIKQDTRSIEENVIATLSAKNEQTNKQKEEKEIAKEQEEQERARIKQQEEERKRAKAQEEQEQERAKAQEAERARVKRQEERARAKAEEKRERAKARKRAEERAKAREEERKRARAKRQEELLAIQKKKAQENIFKYEVIKPRIITIKRGDSLASIAKRFYGNAMDFKRIIRANPRIRSSKTALRFGEKIIIPRKDNKKTRRYIIVKKGYSLAFIAKKVYGDKNQIAKIVRANYNIKSKHSTIHIGQKIYVPR